MDCRTARMLMPYARPPAELPAEEQALVERHLADCPECRALARRERQFDAAVGRAMLAVEVPAGLREKIGVGLAQERGRTIHRRAWQVVALAACVLLALSFPLGWWSSKGEINPADLVDAEEAQFVAEIDNPSRELADQFFRSRGVKVELPADFDYGLLKRLDVVNLNGKDVAQLEFENGPDRVKIYRVKIYVLPTRYFRIAKNTDGSARGSHCTVEVVQASNDFLFVIVYFGDANRQHFMPRGVVG